MRQAILRGTPVWGMEGSLMLDFASTDLISGVESTKALFRNALFWNTLFGNALFSNALFANGLLANAWSILIAVIYAWWLNDDQG